MQLTRRRLVVLLNALYDTGTTTISVAHPSDAIGTLFSFELEKPTKSTIRITCDGEVYAERRATVDSTYGPPAVSELPQRQSFVNAFLGGGLLDPVNRTDITNFLDRYGSPDLTAGHRPVLAGFDTNLLAWRIDDVLGLTPGSAEVVNGFALATGVRDELDWDKKRSDTKSLEEAFGPSFQELWNQPAGANREGRMGELCYRQLRDGQYSEEIQSGTGDEAIIEGYDGFQRNSQKDVLLFSNDRDFIERARAHRVLAQRVEFPQRLPQTLTGSWVEIQDTLYVLAVLFGVLELPKVTLYGVWRGKEGQAWHNEELKLDCRSPKLKPIIERDTAIIDAYEQKQ